MTDMTKGSPNSRVEVKFTHIVPTPAGVIQQLEAAGKQVKVEEVYRTNFLMERTEAIALYEQLRAVLWPYSEPASPLKESALPKLSPEYQEIIDKLEKVAEENAKKAQAAESNFPPFKSQNPLRHKYDPNVTPYRSGFIAAAAAGVPYNNIYGAKL